MKQGLVKYLYCPECEGKLLLTIFNEVGHEVYDGYFKCQMCRKPWIILDGIPRFVQDNVIRNSGCFPPFLMKYKTKLIDIGWVIRDRSEKNTDLEELKEKTSKYFGYEWDYFKDWGWIRDEEVTEEEKKYDFRGGLVSNTESAFKMKCMLDAGNLGKGKLVLDAGCGNGRYTNQAARYGAEVIGIDLGYGVESAYEHLKDKENIHIVQGDLFALPFKKGIFDTAFSNGVLMHTGDAQKAFYSITKHIKKSGVFVSHLYHKRNWVFEIVDGTIRFFTTKLSVENNLKFARFMADWGKKLMENGKWKTYFRYIEILPTLHHMFDWYSAPIATHHTYPEVKKWYQDMGFEIIQSNEPQAITLMNKPESLTLKGIKK